MLGKGPAPLHNVHSYKDKPCARGRGLSQSCTSRTPCGGRGTSRGVILGVLFGVWRLCGRGSCELGRVGQLGQPAHKWRPGSQEAAFPGCSSKTPVLTNHNLSLPLSLQPHLPPDLSKQGEKLQTWQSAFWAVADSCQGAAGARSACGGRRDPPCSSSHPQTELDLTWRLLS